MELISSRSVLCGGLRANHFPKRIAFGSVDQTPGGGAVLPYVTLTGTCGPIGYGFQGVLS